MQTLKQLYAFCILKYTNRNRGLNNFPQAGFCSGAPDIDDLTGTADLNRQSRFGVSLVGSQTPGPGVDSLATGELP